MDEHELAQRFERHRPRLRAMAYRLLGSWSDAEDVIQDCWFRLGRSEVVEIDNLGGWLTTKPAACPHRPTTPGPPRSTTSRAPSSSATAPPPSR